MRSLCYLNGKILPVQDARVGVYDLGLLRGFGIYEGLITHNRKPFMLAEHLKRFRRSAQRMQLKIPTSDSAIAGAMKKLIANNVPKGKEGLIRVILTGGTAIDGIKHDHRKPTFYILIEEFHPISKRYLETGCAIGVFDHERKFPETKTTNYIQAVLLQKEREKKNVLEILYISGQRVLEATGSNIFIVKKGTLVTPQNGILLGVTRHVVIKLMRQDRRVEERHVSLKELYRADEAFITGSFKEVVPVVKIGTRKIGNGNVGPVTKEVMRRFHEFAQKY